MKRFMKFSALLLACVLCMGAFSRDSGKDRNPTIHFEGRYTGAATAQTLATPAVSTNAISLDDITITTSAACTITVFAGTDATGNRILDIYAPDNGGIDKAFNPPLQLPINTALKITTSAGNAKVTGHEHEVTP